MAQTTATCCKRGPLPDVPLFFTPGRYVNVPMDATYDAAWQATPRRWRDVIAAPTA